MPKPVIVIGCLLVVAGIVFLPYSLIYYVVVAIAVVAVGAGLIACSFLNINLKKIIVFSVIPPMAVMVVFYAYIELVARPFIS